MSTDKHSIATVTVPLPTMLNDIYSESLAHLLTSVLSKTSPVGLTHIPALDAHLFSTAKHSSPDSSLNHGDVIEIQGASSSGKTHLVYHLLLDCITPSGYNAIDLGGWAKAGIVFDMDHTFDIVRFNGLLRGRLTRLIGGTNASTIDFIAQRSLERLHIFRPSSSSELAVTISHLAQYHSMRLANEEIGIVAIDSMSAHYWPDRFIAEQMRTAAAAPPEHLKGAHIAPLQHVLWALESFRHTHGTVTVLTNWGLHAISSSNPILFRQHLHPFPVPFLHSHAKPRQDANAAVSISRENTLRLTCHITVHQEPSGMTGTAATRDGTWDVSQASSVVGVVRTPNHPAVTKFVLSVTANDIMAN